MLAVHFLHGAKIESYGGLLRNLCHNYLVNQKNDYPKTLQETFILLKGWNRGSVTSVPRPTVCVAFNVNGDVMEEVTALVTSHIQMHYCKAPQGQHYATH